jgi:cation diffusion facilitator CzcD-associated flavoprotein CzcO
LTFQVHGLGGRNLNSEWEKEAVSYKGITVSGYPDYFKVNGPNTGTGHSSQISYMEAATDYIVQAICAVKRDKRIKAIDARRDLQDGGHQSLPGTGDRVHPFAQVVPLE